MFIPKRILFLFFSILFFCSSASANFDSAFKLYEKGKYAEAFYAFKNLAYIGDKSSQFNLGVMYFRGEHVQSDPVEAYAWIVVAAERGDESFLKTKKIIFGKFNEKEQLAAVDRADLYLNKYGREVLSQALAPKPLSDDECDKGPERIKKVKAEYPDNFKYTGTLGYADIIFNISSQGYARDTSVRVTTDSAFFKSSARALIKSRWQPIESDGHRITKRGVEYRFTYVGFRNGKYDTHKFVSHAEKTLLLAQSGDVKSQYEYAQTLQTARILKDKIKKLDVEFKDSNEWYLRSAQQGHPLAQYELGKNMLQGKGCEADVETGLKWLRAAAFSGHPYAQEEIAMSVISEGGTNVEQALLWLRKAANSDVYPPKLFLAWELVANPSRNLRDGEEALRLLKVKPKYYYD